MEQEQQPERPINDAIQPLSEKEANVWKACHALYFNDELSYKAITLRRILGKRSLLEEDSPNKTKGDNSGLSAMKARWAAHHGIDPDNDPHMNSANGVGEGEDPLLRASKLVREQLIGELDEQYQGMIDTAENKAFHLEEKVSQLQSEHKTLNQSYDALKTELDTLKPQQHKSLEQIVALQIKVDTVTDVNQTLQHSIQQLSSDMESTWQQRFNTELSNKDQQIQQLTHQSDALQAEIKATRDALMEINENQRHQAIMDIEHLNTKMTALQSALKHQQTVEMQLAKTNQVKTQLATQLNEIKTQYAEQQALVGSLQTQINQQLGELKAAQQQSEFELTLKAQLEDQAVLITQLIKSTIAKKKSNSSKKDTQLLIPALQLIDE